MKFFASAFLAAAFVYGIPTASFAVTSDSKGPKVIEIDEAGNVRTTSGTGNESNSVQTTTHQPATAVVPSETHARMSICDPRYSWLPHGLSSDKVARTRAFYRDVTKKYEMAQISARKQGTTLSRDREEQYWGAYKILMDSVAQGERKVVERGISPRLSWWCNAPPVIQKASKPPPPLTTK
jgi:hypothetical protein